MLSTALYEGFFSRGEADYQNELFSAMRFQFGGHLEKPSVNRSSTRLSLRPLRGAVVAADLAYRCALASRMNRRSWRRFLDRELSGSIDEKDDRS